MSGVDETKLPPSIQLILKIEPNEYIDPNDMNKKKDYEKRIENMINECEMVIQENQRQSSISYDSDNDNLNKIQLKRELLVAKSKRMMNKKNIELLI